MTSDDVHDTKKSIGPSRRNYYFIWSKFINGMYISIEDPPHVGEKPVLQVLMIIGKQKEHARRKRYNKVRINYFLKHL